MAPTGDPLRGGRHKCPVDQCQQVCPHHILMCKPHWYKVPKNVRDAVWHFWAHGQMKEGYFEARQQAIDAVNAKEKP